MFSEQVRVPKFGTRKNGVRNDEKENGTIKVMDTDPQKESSCLHGGDPACAWRIRDRSCRDAKENQKEVIAKTDQKRKLIRSRRRKQI